VVAETKEILKEGELIYISTDEKKMDTFKPFYARYPKVRFYVCTMHCTLYTILTILSIPQGALPERLQRQGGHVLPAQ
jgi:hypothetical protein